MSSAVTLSPSAPSQTLSGTIIAAGDIGKFAITQNGTTATETLYAAVFGPAPTQFSLLTTGTIASTGPENAFGIVLASPGKINNSGDISGAAGGIALLGAGQSGYLKNTGTITGGTEGILAEHSAIVTNFATITGGTDGIYLAGGGFAYNFGGTISAAADGILAAAPIFIKNAGLIAATGTAGIGINLQGGGNIINYAGATITGDTGVDLNGGTLTNAGLIEQIGSRGYGVTVTGTLASQSSGTINNQSGGTIEGVFFTGSGLIENAGLISGTIGINIDDYNFATPGSTVTIVNSGSLYGKYDAISSDNTNEHGVDIINQAGGRITGGYGFFFFMNGSATLTNAGYISGTAGAAAYIYGGVTNTGTMRGHGVGVEFFRGTLINSGLIAAEGTITRDHEPNPTPSTYSAGIIAGIYSSLTNTSSGTISGSRNGVQLGGATGYNFGLITGNTAVALSGLGLNVPGLATNLYNYGSLAGSTIGVYNSYGTVRIYNYTSGRITGKTGILAYAGQIYNAGTISASGTGIIVTHGGTIFDSGLIAGAGGTAISFAAGHANRLDLAPTATITGAITLNGALDLEAGTRIGTLNGAALHNLTALTIDSQADWSLTQNLTTTAKTTLTNNGTLNDLGTLTLNGKLAGAGTIDLNHTPLTLNGAAAATQHLAFTGTNETLTLGDAAAMHAKITHFATGDTIVITTLSPASKLTDTFANGVLTVTTIGSTAFSLTFANPAAFKTETFSLIDDGSQVGIILTGTAAAARLTSQGAYAPQKYLQATPSRYTQVSIAAGQGSWLSIDAANKAHGTIPVITL